MIVKEQMHDFSAGEIVPSAFLDRLQLDDVALSTAIVEGLRHYHFPLTVTDEHILSATAAADQFTLESGVTLIVGGVIFNTADFDSLTFGVPDNSTRFLRAEVASDCGTLEAWETTEGVYADPMVRKRTCNLYLTTGSEEDAQGAGGGPSGASSMRLLKAVKGVAGTPPVLTYYVNDGLDPATSVATHEASDPAHPANKISYDNSTAGLEGDPSRVQSAIDALAARTLSPLSAPLSLYVATTGDDAHDGLSAATALRTIDHAISIISDQYALGDYNATITVAAGIYNECVRLRPYQAGIGQVLIIGAGIDQTIIQYATASTGSISSITSMIGAGSYRISNISVLSPVVSATVRQAINVPYGTIVFENVAFVGGNVSNYVIIASGSAIINFSSGCSVAGTNLYVLIGALGGASIVIRNSLTINGDVTIGTVYATSASKIEIDVTMSPVVTGTVTGPRYLANTNSIINTSGGGANYFPGTVAGSTASGGQYV